MLRTRDLVALLAAVVLTRMAYHDTMESLAATAHLSFYVPRNDGDHSVAPAVLDIDGDGVAEALARVENRDNKFYVQILDLKPGMTAHANLAPFQPKVLLEASPVSIPVTGHMEFTEPLALTTGHINVQGGEEVAVKAPAASTNAKVNERTRHYFCGSDWHDASSKCAQPCPGGDSTECPGTERCFADTPCDYYNVRSDRPLLESGNLRLTPAGSLPAIVTLWETGVVTCHALTSDNSTKRNELELRLLWQQNPLENYTVIDFHSPSMTLVDGIDAGNGHGMIIVSSAAHIASPGATDDDDFFDTIAFALDAKTGATIWETVSDKARESAQQLLLPMERGETSAARRRSLNPNLPDPSRRRDKPLGLAGTNCMHAYRRSLLVSGALPHLHWGDDDTLIKVLHFDHQQDHGQRQQHGHAHHKKKHGAGQKLLGKSAAKAKSAVGHAKKWSKSLLPGKRHRNKLRFGRPNVVAVYKAEGLDIRSLKNGRSLCHLSLWEMTLYADLNHDGILDSASLLTGTHYLEDDDHMDASQRWVTKLAATVKGMNKPNKNDTEELLRQHMQDVELCHVQVLSGLPSKEELFAVNVCGPKRYQQDNIDRFNNVQPAPLLAVESFRRNGNDLIAAVSSGVVTRIDGTTGWRQWQLHGKHYPDFPHWDDELVVAMTRIESRHVVPATRPVLLVGENSLVLLSARRGKYLASATFPQPSLMQPQIMDLNGDGTSDVLVVTADAYWGYNIHVRTGTSIGFRLVVGLLLLGMMLALLRNRFGPHPGKRSTDA